MKKAAGTICRADLHIQPNSLHWISRLKIEIKILRLIFRMKYKVFPAVRLILTMILLSAVGIIIGIYLRGYTEQRWIKFTPDDRSFAALFPQPPIYEVEPATPPFVNSQTHLFTAHTPRGSYQIACFEPSAELKSAEAILVADAVARFGGTLEKEAPGETFILSMEDGSVVYGRILRVRQRIYRLLVSRPDRHEADEEITRFFNSFVPQTSRIFPISSYLFGTLFAVIGVALIQTRAWAKRGE